MKIAVTSTGQEISSQLEQKFGRAEYFIIAETSTMEFQVIDNKASLEAGGAGIQAGQTIINSGATVLITGNVGPNAMKVLKSGKIKIYRGQRESVEKNIEMFNKHSLEEIVDSVEAHHGMKNENSST
ncbi:MAG: NifB/NifX family molybdenum-iron cluster-binding protein [Clostridia bacterium]|nr:NifB/NifX family molybdenum-iron cluster-binding protein [Clostridia bacterium]